MSREIRNDLKTKKASIKLLIRAPFKLSENLLSKSEAGRKGKGGRGGGEEEYFISILLKICKKCMTVFCFLEKKSLYLVCEYPYRNQTIPFKK